MNPLLDRGFTKKSSLIFFDRLLKFLFGVLRLSLTFSMLDINIWIGMFKANAFAN